MTPDPISVLFSLGLGPWLIPLEGKIPMLDAWPDLPPVDERVVRFWHAKGSNLGLRCGFKSGLVVIDDDRLKHGLEPFEFPPTGLMARSPTGGRHGFYRLPDGVVVGNSASKLAPHVDVRSEGGQVAVAPSIHPITGTAYEWIETGEPAVLPAEIVQLLSAAAEPVASQRAPGAAQGGRRHSAAAEPAGQSYAQSALVREVAAVRVASEGTRNDTLNRAAFNLGQLVGGGALAEADVVAELAAAARIAGLPEREAASTIASGVRAGVAKPRTAPERPERSQRKPEASTATAPRAGLERGDVLVPGAHILPSGEYVEQGNDDFCRECFAALQPGAIYRRGGAVGEIRGAEFVPVSADRLRTIVDRHVRLVSGKPPKKDGEDPRIVYQPLSRDLGSMLIEYAAACGEVRELRYIATFPVCLGLNFQIAAPGWNAEHGVFLVCESVPIPFDLARSKAVIEDAIIDFPFARAADRENYIGLMLTVVLRAAIGEPVPMHLIGASSPRSGKTKLAEIVLGCGVLGAPTPAMQIGVREEEREKRITASLLTGDTVIHLDNLSDFLDSAALASLLTSSIYRGRELGHTRLLSLPNLVTIVGTGNNVHATEEITKRVIPIILQPRTDSPETRTDYKHPLLREFVEGARDDIRASLLGLIEHWKSVGRPLGKARLGGFERWSAVVGGIMAAAGYSSWMSNMAEWRGSSDEFAAERTEFVRLWQAHYQGNWIDTGSLFMIVEGAGLFDRQIRGESERGRRSTFGRYVLAALENVVVGPWRIEMRGAGKTRMARLASAAGDSPVNQ